MKYTTLNQIINVIETISNSQGQVNSFYFGQEFNMASFDQVNYPMVWSNVLDTTFSEKVLEISMDICVLDIQKVNLTNERDTLSDTLSILRDIFAELNSDLYQDYFIIDQNSSIEAVREAFTDIVNGWRMNVKFILPQLNNRCQVPQ